VAVWSMGHVFVRVGRPLLGVGLSAVAYYHRPKRPLSSMYRRMSGFWQCSRGRRGAEQELPDRLALV
jgi:hypothetical protein